MFLEGITLHILCPPAVKWWLFDRCLCASGKKRPVQVFCLQCFRAPVLPVNSCAWGYQTTCFFVYVIHYCMRHLRISLSENKYLLSIHSISLRYLRVSYLHFKRREVKYTAGQQALATHFEECFQCSHASWPSQMNLYSPPKAHLNKHIAIPFEHATLPCTTKPRHFAHTDILNISIVIPVVICIHVFTLQFWKSIFRS